MHPPTPLPTLLPILQQQQHQQQKTEVDLKRGFLFLSCPICFSRYDPTESSMKDLTDNDVGYGASYARAKRSNLCVQPNLLGGWTSNIASSGLGGYEINFSTNKWIKRTVKVCQSRTLSIHWKFFKKYKYFKTTCWSLGKFLEIMKMLFHKPSTN